MQNENISPIASGILQGLQEAIADTSGKPVNGTKKSVVYRIEPQIIRQQLINNSICPKVNLLTHSAFHYEPYKVGNKANAKST